MKLTPEERKAWENMKPGAITSQGFLGDQENISLHDLIEADEELMQAHNLDFDEVGEKLLYLLEEGKKGLGEPITVEKKWIVRTDDTRGFLPCPFEDGIYHKTNLELSNIDESIKLICSELSIHLLTKHHFLQGKGSPFRLEPKTLKSLLEL
ncbi:hypothetical protein [Spirochaeta cellobiosiphila]|uniref:hypothetical protein n=1 Tax=Spirochaeta cellobiosiphila TaxID=504483 RepID=UPI00041B4261|nr:hypothetical protein [Spirochaeta cellobiosiphila]